MLSGLNNVITAALLLVIIASFLLFPSNLVNATTIVPLEDNRDWLSEVITIDSGEEGAYSPQIAVQGDMLYVVWTGTRGIMFAKSIDNGKTFSDPLNLAGYPESTSVGMDPHIMASNDNVYVLYSSGRDILLLSSQNRGETFSEAVNVSKTDPNIQPLVVTDHVISIFDEKRVYAAWTIVSGSWAEIFFAQSSDGGATFGSPINVSNNEDDSSIPVIASFGDHVYLAWRDVDTKGSAIHHVSFAKSDDWGQSFQTTYNLSNNTGIYYSVEHQVAAGQDNTVYVTWRNEIENGSELIIAKSVDSGKSFQNPIVLGLGARPQLSVQGENLYVAWTSLNDRIAFSYSTDGGTSFSVPVIVSQNAFRTSPYYEMPTPSLSADGSNVFIAWHSAINGTNGETDEVLLVTSYNGGTSFTSELNVSNTPGVDSGHPIAVAAPLDKIFVMWLEESMDSEIGTEIVLIKGQIPETYTQPFRQDVGTMTPIEPYNAGQFLPIIGVGAAIAAVIAFLTLRKRR
jgi:hypothetical protein